jgi:hypothetical protein
LVNGVVFGVDGKEGDVVFLGGGDDKFAGGDQTLLVGQTYGFSGANCGVGGFEAGYSNDGGDDEVDLRESRNADAAEGAVEDFDVGDAYGLEAGF